MKMRRWISCLLRQAVFPVFLICCLWGVGMPGSGEARAAEVVDRIVAIVNDDIIRLSDLNSQFEPIEQRIRSRGLPFAQEAEALYEARRELIQDLIDEKLADQVIREAGIRAGQGEIDAAIERIKASNRLTEEDLRQALQARGMSMEDYREDIRQQILRNKLIDRKIKSRIVITEGDIREHFESNPEKYGLTGKYRLQNIFMPYGGDENETLRKMETALDELKAGASFSETAKSYSMGPNASDGGELGTFAFDDLSDHLRPVLLDLEPGDFTDIIETQLGYQIFYLADVEEPEEREVEDAMREIEQQLYEQKVEEKFDEWLESLRESAHIRVKL